VIRRRWDAIPTSAKRGVALLAAGASALALAVAVVKLVELKWLFPPNDGLSAKEAAEETGRVRTSLLAALAGIIAVVGAIYTARSYELSRQGQITERFTRAVEQLGSDKLDVSLGGIYALERIARDSKRDRKAIAQILAEHARERAPAQLDGADPDPSHRPPADVQAVMTVLGAPAMQPDKVAGNRGGPPARGDRLDLSRVDLRNAVLERLHLEHAFFWKADLRGARCYGAHLDGADFGGACARHADYWEAHLKNVSFKDADLSDANLARADLRGARFAEDDGGNSAVLAGAILDDAKANSSTVWVDRPPAGIRTLD
jgi:uncharacterized protein YjbI with pentapeptide repeats